MLAFVASFLDMAFASAFVGFGGVEQIAVRGGREDFGFGAQPAFAGGDVGCYDGVLSCG